MPERKADPFMTCNFHVELDGIIVAGFSEASGLSFQTEFETVKEGGVNDFEYKLPVRTKVGDLTLKRGFCETNDLYKWYEEVMAGIVVRKNGSIHLMNHVGEQKMSWDFYDALPMKWDGPALSASSAAVAVESLTLTFHRLTKRK